MTAYGYIRKSVMAEDSTSLSPEVQRQRIADLAAAHDDHDLEVIEDLNVSGAKVEQRRGYMRLVKAIESGDAHAVYAYDLSRLHRNTKEALRFFEICRDRGVPVRMIGDPIDTSGPTGELVLTVLAAMNTWVSKITSVKIKASLKRKAETGYVHGAPKYGGRPGEDPDRVVAAFKQAGSFNGAARLLNADGVPVRTKNGAWSGTSVAEIVRRHAPDEVAPSRGRGATARHGTFMFSRLLTCSVCGHYLTGSRDARTGGVRYECTRARTVPHPRSWVNESKLVPVIRAAAAKRDLVIRRKTIGKPGDSAKRERLEKRRAALADLVLDGLVTRAEAKQRAAAIDAELAQLQDRRRIIDVGLFPVFEAKPVKGTDEIVPASAPGHVNDYLTRIIERAVVDMSQPAKRGPSKWLPTIEFEWRNQAT